MSKDKPCVLVIHSSRFGQSTKIAQAIVDEMAACGVDSDLQALSATTAPDPDRHDAVALVASVRYGHFDANAPKFLAAHRAWIDAHPSLLVTVSLTARTEAKRDPAVHTYTKKFLEETTWVPTRTEVVAGMLDYPSYKIWDRLAIQLIMTMTKGPTDPKTVIEYTDWDRVKEVADEFAKLVTDAPGVSENLNRR
ncbi:MAG: menaquinone-dependent protoporphyrinogen IX dehydrogenase [Propionibacteriaceae bacterium]|nr:menaquinone-dependent protoporphyrinogen IX dehydrogenase [Propionibacteriaceae bacterium]